jgi:hypothetical protein
MRETGALECEEINFSGIPARARSVYALATRWSILKLSAMIVVLGEER